jgi:hypothetical protein
LGHFLGSNHCVTPDIIWIKVPARVPVRFSSLRRWHEIILPKKSSVFNKLTTKGSRVYSAMQPSESEGKKGLHKKIEKVVQFKRGRPFLSRLRLLKAPGSLFPLSAYPDFHLTCDGTLVWDLTPWSYTFTRCLLLPSFSEMAIPIQAFNLKNHSNFNFVEKPAIFPLTNISLSTIIRFLESSAEIY